MSSVKNDLTLNKTCNCCIIFQWNKVCCNKLYGLKIIHFLGFLGGYIHNYFTSSHSHLFEKLTFFQKLWLPHVTGHFTHEGKYSTSTHHSDTSFGDNISNKNPLRKQFDQLKPKNALWCLKPDKFQGNWMTIFLAGECFKIQ